MDSKDIGKKSKPEGNYNMARIVDLTAYRLERLLNDNETDAWLHQALLDILGDYYLGLIAIGWQDGQPIVMPLRDNYGWTKGIPPGFSMVTLDRERIVEKDRSEYEELPPLPEPIEPPDDEE